MMPTNDKAEVSSTTKEEQDLQTVENYSRYGRADLIGQHTRNTATADLDIDLYTGKKKKDKLTDQLLDALALAEKQLRDLLDDLDTLLDEYHDNQKALKALNTLQSLHKRGEVDLNAHHHLLLFEQAGLDTGAYNQDDPHAFGEEIENRQQIQRRLIEDMKEIANEIDGLSAEHPALSSHPNMAELLAQYETIKAEAENEELDFSTEVLNEARKDNRGSEFLQEKMVEENENRHKHDVSHDSSQDKEDAAPSVTAQPAAMPF